MVSYLTDPTSPIPSHCALIVATSTIRVNFAQINLAAVRSQIHVIYTISGHQAKFTMYSTVQVFSAIYQMLITS